MKLIKIIIPCLLVGGCLLGTSKSSKFYTQSPVAAEAISTEYKAFVGVNKIQLPKYIDRPQIVTQQKDSAQVTISEYNRWIEYPSLLATRVLIEDLNNLLPTAKIKMNLLKGEQFDKLISVEITDITAVLGNKAELIAWYTIKNDSGKVLAQQKFESTVQIGKTYDDVSKGYSQLLAQLSQKIAQELIQK